MPKLLMFPRFPSFRKTFSFFIFSLHLGGRCGYPCRCSGQKIPRLSFLLQSSSAASTSHFIFFTSSISILSSYGDCHGLALGHRLGQLTQPALVTLHLWRWEALPQCDDTFCPHISVVYFSDYKNSKSLFSMSASPLLPCKQVHQYHPFRFHMCVLIYDICLSLSDLLHLV